MQKKFDILRRQTGELGNHALDEFFAGRLSRRELICAAGKLGFGTLLAGSGVIGPRSASAQVAVKPTTATIRIAHLTPPGAIDPLTIADGVSTTLINQCAEYLVYDGEHQILSPGLAESWAPNDKCDVWTFRLRRGVQFHDGTRLSANDVVATFDRLTDPNLGSYAMATYRGVLQKGSTIAVDEHTVAFNLTSPNVSFPYLVSSDVFNAVILPASYRGGFEKTFVGTGPFKLEKYVPKFGASFVRNTEYWGAPVLPARLEFRFYADGPARILAARSGQVDVISALAIENTLDFAHNDAFRIQSIQSSAHRQIHMRTDVGPFKDKRVRQALALSLNRDALVRGLMRGRAALGNDSPFAPVFAVTDTTVPQRERDIPAAKRLMLQAGFPNGFPISLTTEKWKEIPDLAVIVQNAAQEIGIDVTLRSESQQLYYGTAKPGRSDWLDSPFAITDYGHRGVPNTFLGPPLTSWGKWNASHFSNPTYDKLYAEFVGALAIADQKRIAGQIQRLLLDETPIVFPYFYDYLIATSRRIQGVTFTAIGQVYLNRTTLSEE